MSKWKLDSMSIYELPFNTLVTKSYEHKKNAAKIKIKTKLYPRGSIEALYKWRELRILQENERSQMFLGSSFVLLD